jgi:outer membrane biosynthesis protein TonB
LATLLASAAAHPGSVLIFELTRETPKPLLRVQVGGDGAGIVQSAPIGIHCGGDCSMSLEPGSLVRLTATVGEGSTFEGWQGPCGSQAPELYAWADEVLFPFGTEDDPGEIALHNFLVDASDRPLDEFPLECELTLAKSLEVRATFGVPPEVVEVAMLDTPPMDEEELEEMTVSLPKSTWEPEELLDLDEEDLLEEKPEEPEPPQLPIPQPQVATAPPPPPTPKIQAAPKMKAVEVPDENEVEEAPDDARFLSDKNRDVAEETHATETNLDKQSDGERVASAESTLDSEEIGAEEAEIAQTEDMEASALDADRDNDEALGSESGEVVMKHSGEDGDDGDDGESGDNSPSETPGLLSMRNIEGRGELGSSGETVPEPPKTDPGSGGTRGKRGNKGTKGPKLRLDQEDYVRIVGTEVADSEMAVAKRKQSRRRGRWERKMGMLKSSLENFTPEVRPGNQTALKTRAAPFAIYIARMHRRIHELWGFGFLEELDGKSTSHELNDWNLAVKLEIVLNPDGSIDKMTFVRPSGLLAFDVAALDAVDTSSPFEATPSKIRSPDGKVYLHWTFHRDWRQCGTFSAEPFILAAPRGKHDSGFDDSAILRSSGRRAKRSAASKRAPAPARPSPSAAAASARASANLASPDDPRAQHAANLWLSAFVAGNHAKLAKASAAPFYSAGQVVAKSNTEIAAVYRSVISETSNRRIRDWKLLSAAGYRRSFGALPAGLDATGSEVFLVVKLKSDLITLVLQQSSKGYRVNGLYR